MDLLERRNSSFKTLFQEVTEKLWGASSYRNVEGLLAKFGYVQVGFTPVLGRYTRNYKYIKKGRRYRKTVQQVFESVEFGSERCVRISFALVTREKKQKRVYGLSELHSC